LSLIPFWEKLRSLIYELLELTDKTEEELREASTSVKLGFPSMLRGGVIMDVTNSKQAGLAEDA
jgi:pyridoxal 5'-phosphate synthase pdxS subunit